MKTERTDAQVVTTVARLQEFYTSSSLFVFFKQCEVRDVDVVEAFAALEVLVLGYVAECGRPPDLQVASTCLLLSLRPQGRAHADSAAETSARHHR